MHRLAVRSLRTLAGVALATLFTCTSATHADHVMLQAGPYVYHRNHDINHNDVPLMVGVEWESASRWEFGASYFKNSFYQPSMYIYAGKRWFLGSEANGFYFKLTGGPLYGYKGPYEDKVPLNHGGLAPAVIPGIGYQYQRASAQLVFLGTAGLMLTFGYDFWK